MIYQSVLMEHYRFPRNRGMLENAQFSSSQLNPSCGDSLACTGILAANDTIDNIKFTGSGCVISQATASMLSEYVIGKSVKEIGTLDSSFMQKLIGLDLGPVRLRCALLSLEVLQEAIREKS